MKNSSVLVLAWFISVLFISGCVVMGRRTLADIRKLEHHVGYMEGLTDGIRILKPFSYPLLGKMTPNEFEDLAEDAARETDRRLEKREKELGIKP